MDRTDSCASQSAAAHPQVRHQQENEETRFATTVSSIVAANQPCCVLFLRSSSLQSIALQCDSSALHVMVPVCSNRDFLFCRRDHLVSHKGAHWVEEGALSSDLPPRVGAVVIDQLRTDSMGWRNTTNLRNAEPPNPRYGVPPPVI